MVTLLKNWSRYLLALFYPAECIRCKTLIPLDEGDLRLLCSNCYAKVKFISPPFCLRCGRPENLENSLLSYSFCSECRRSPPFFDTARAVAFYDGIWKEVIHIFKYRKGDYLDKFLTGFMFELFKNNQYLRDCNLLIPVPLHWMDKWRRGYNQVYLLTCQLSRLTGIPLLKNSLVKWKSVPSQTKLKKEERLKNVKATFKIRNPKLIKGKTILLVDDVFTTGATVNECARILKEAGVREVHVVTLAHG